MIDLGKKYNLTFRSRVVSSDGAIYPDLLDMYAGLGKERNFMFSSEDVMSSEVVCPL